MPDCSRGHEPSDTRRAPEVVAPTNRINVALPLSKIRNNSEVCRIKWLVWKVAPIFPLRQSDSILATAWRSARGWMVLTSRDPTRVWRWTSGTTPPTRRGRLGIPRGDSPPPA